MFIKFKSVFFLSVSAMLINILLLSNAHSQMFTVGDSDSDSQQTRFFYSSLSIGWEIADFSFSGDPQLVEDRFDFNDGILSIRFENPGLDFYFGIAGGLTGMENHNYMSLGGILYNDIVLSRSENFWLLLPLQINTDLKRSQRDGTSRQFQQSAFQVGSGLAARAQLSNVFRISGRAIPSYGYSFSQGSFFGGTVFSFTGKTRLYIEEIFPNRAIVFGYDYNFNRYNIDGDVFDYDFSGHAFTIGLTF